MWNGSVMYLNNKKTKFRLSFKQRIQYDYIHQGKSAQNA